MSGQLRSLTGQCMFATNDLLQQVFTVGAGLTSLVLYQSGEPRVLELTGHLSVKLYRSLV